MTMAEAKIVPPGTYEARDFCESLFQELPRDARYKNVAFEQFLPSMTHAGKSAIEFSLPPLLTDSVYLLKVRSVGNLKK